MRKYFKSFLDEMGFPKDAEQEILHAFDKLVLSSEAYKKFSNAVDMYKDAGFNFIAHDSSLYNAYQQAGLEIYQGRLLFLIALTKQLKVLYAQKNIPEHIQKETLCDIFYKSRKCKILHGYWGNFTRIWFSHLFALKVFGFGLLQFETCRFDREVKAAGRTFKAGDFCINVHIPNTGMPLEHCKLKEIYLKAKQFFIEFFPERYNGEIAFTCDSWLLSPQNKLFLKPTSNILQFADDFELLKEVECVDYSDLWRIFMTIEKDPDKLPQDTSLQRGYVDLMKKRQKTTHGYGLFLL